MPAQRRLKLVLTIAVVLAAAVWLAVPPGFVTASTALWTSLAIGVAALVAAKFRRHFEVPDVVKLH